MKFQQKLLSLMTGRAGGGGIGAEIVRQVYTTER